jgi:hypothetical protein
MVDAVLTKPHRSLYAGLFIGFFLLLVSFVNLGRVPSFWWDEGWTLLVAKNWVERGFYGRLLDGQLAPPGLQAAFPVVAPVALSFRVFGVGLWQGRLPGVLLTLASLGMIYYLAKRIYSLPVAIGTLFVLVAMLVHPAINPIYNGRMVLADMPVVFYLLAGYVCFLVALRKQSWFLLLSMLFWGIALVTKIQTLPFWLAAMLVPMGIAALSRRWRTAVILMVTLAGSLLFSRMVVLFQDLILKGHTLPQGALFGTWETMIAVLNFQVRLTTLTSGLLYGLPTLLGLAYAAWQFIKRYKRLDLDDPGLVIWISMLCLATSWFVWYMLLSNGGARYLASPCFLAGMFVSAMLYDVTGHFNLRETWQRAKKALHRSEMSPSNLAALFTVVLGIPYVIATLLLFNGLWLTPDHSVSEVSEYLNTQAPPGSLVETYEAELFFCLKQPYHFPPDQKHIEFLRRQLMDPNLPVIYQPLEANPDYLVVGPIGEEWGVYDQVIADGDFRLLKEYSRYKLYERVRK